jgi:hypothetical protein
MPKGMSTYVLKTVGRLTSGVARTIACEEQSDGLAGEPAHEQVDHDGSEDLDDPREGDRGFQW